MSHQKIIRIPTEEIPKERISLVVGENPWKDLSIIREYLSLEKNTHVLCITPGFLTGKEGNFEEVIHVGEDKDRAPEFLAKHLLYEAEKILFESWTDDLRFNNHEVLLRDFSIPDVGLIIFFPGTSSGWKKALKSRFGEEENLAHFKNSIRTTTPNIVFLGDATFDALKCLL